MMEPGKLNLRSRFASWVKRKIMPDTRSDKIREVAAKIGVPADWLDSIIAFESSYDPQAQNPIPYNKAKVDAGIEAPRHARGLIQFIDSTAAELGYADSYELVASLPDFDSQMDGAVLPYFVRRMPFYSKQDFFMSVFYPSYRKVPAEKPFPDTVIAVNPGIRTPQDYINKVEARVALGRLIRPAGGIAVIAVAAAGAWLLMRG